VPGKKMMGYMKGGKLDMVEKDGKKVPFYAADGKGKMAEGGKVKKKKAAKKKPMTKKKAGSMGMSDLVSKVASKPTPANNTMTPPPKAPAPKPPMGGMGGGAPKPPMGGMGGMAAPKPPMGGAPMGAPPAPAPAGGGMGMPPKKPMGMPGMKKGGKVKKSGGKVRGAGIAKKGVRACKMR